MKTIETLNDVKSGGYRFDHINKLEPQMHLGMNLCSFFFKFVRCVPVAELIGFQRCMHSCLEYLEVVLWVGDEEEEKVLSSVLLLKQNNVGVTPPLKRVSSDVSSPLNDIVTHVIVLVLKINEERGRREMKSLVLKHSDSIDL
ncbi:hypothetical protein Syun_014252 [Stephania yunnanensis]|uniref:Uncharacterized protein n=1 Tax=Stephania yunnanensis TaxID=152371 RepID=A0AAP0JJ63_9MAGN